MTTSMPAGLAATMTRVDGREILVLSLPQPRVAGLERLTSAERAIVDLVVTGMRDLEIARWRGRSVRTVQKQVAAALHKLGLGSRSELAAAMAGGGAL
jgi:DNA-binding NarL/FixJ family response regulator